MTNLKLVFDEEEDRKIEYLKKELGIKATTELVRWLITSKYKEMSKN